MRRDHLRYIRENTTYPAFRGIITFFAYIGYLIALLIFAGSTLYGRGPGDIALGLVAAVAIVILVKVSQELSLMLADIADAVINMGEHKDVDSDDD